MQRINRKRNHNENPQSSVSDSSNLSTNTSEINSSGKLYCLLYDINFF